MPKRKTNEQWLSEVTALVQDEYTFMESYINGLTKIKVCHNACGTIYSVQPKAFLAGNRCPHCNPARKLTTQEFRDKIASLPNGREYQLISEYEGHHRSITVIHAVCGYTYSVTASDFIKGTRCTKCLARAKTKPQDVWEYQVKSLTENEYSFLDPYVRDDVKLRYRHNLCGTEHTMTPNNFLNGTRCAKCKESNGEINVRNFLINNHIKYEAQKRFTDLRNVKPLSYDFFLPDLNILIEFQGEQHYRPVSLFGGEQQYKVQKKHDKMKKDYAESKGIPLIEVTFKENTYSKVEAKLAPAIANLVNNS